MKRRFISFLLVLLIVFSFAGCKKKKKEDIIPESSAPISISERSSDVSEEISSDVPDISSSGSEISVIPEPEPSDDTEEDILPEDGYYYSKEDVALYIHLYGKLPSNFITKKEARDLGWTGGSVEAYKKGAAIGGDYFGNYEGLLPKGHKYYECDINTKGKKSRGGERIIFSTDGLIYYSADHYENFVLLYGED